MFIAALSKITRNWKQPKCTSTGEWMWYIHIVDCYSEIIKNELLIHTVWMNLKGIMLKKARLQRLLTVLFHLYDILRKTKNYSHGKQIRGFQRLGVGGGSDYKGLAQGSFLGYFYICAKTHRTYSPKKSTLPYANLKNTIKRIYGFELKWWLEHKRFISNSSQDSNQ